MDIDGKQIYIGRASHHGDLLPAKVIPEKRAAYVCHGGKEHHKDSFQVKNVQISHYKCKQCFSDRFYVKEDTIGSLVQMDRFQRERLKVAERAMAKDFT